MISLPIKGVPVQDTDLTVLDEILSQRKNELDAGMEDDEFFEFFTAQQILRDYQLDPEEIKSGVVSQLAQSKTPGTDRGIDAIYLLVNGRLIRDLDQARGLRSMKQNIVFDVIIIQSSRETGFGMDRILRLKDTSENIFRIERQSDAFSETYNEELIDCINRFREAHRALITKHPTFQVSYFYTTRGDATKVATDIRRKAQALESEIPSALATITKCSFTFVGARDLIDLYRKPPKSTFTLKCDRQYRSRWGRVPSAR